MLSGSRKTRTSAPEMELAADITSLAASDSPWWTTARLWHPGRRTARVGCCQGRGRRGPQLPRWSWPPISARWLLLTHRGGLPPGCGIRVEEQLELDVVRVAEDEDLSSRDGVGRRY